MIKDNIKKQIIDAMKARDEINALLETKKKK